MRNLFVVASIALALAACGGSQTAPSNAASSSSATPASSAAPVDSSAPASSSTPAASTSAAASATPSGSAAPSGSSAAATPPPEAHPFAKDTAAAEEMIDDAIDTRHADVDKCCADARKRWNEPHAKISLLIGIDQEGNIIGVKRPSKKDKSDEQFLGCVRAALHGAAFPKSHAGVITIKKTYEDTLATPSSNPSIKVTN